VNNLYRIQLVLKIEPGVSFSKVKQLLKMQSGALLQVKEFSAVRVICDVDA